MGIEAIQNKDMLAYKSECYVGMTVDDAKEMGRSVFHEFKKINTDNDNILSFDEIVAQRDKASTKKRRWGNLALGLSAYYCYNGIKLERQPKELQELASEIASNLLNKKITPKSTKIMNLLNTLFFLGIGATKYLKSKNTDKETQEYANAYYKQIADNTEVKT